jgi:hypothetical protein
MSIDGERRPDRRPICGCLFGGRVTGCPENLSGPREFADAIELAGEALAIDEAHGEKELPAPLADFVNRNRAEAG